MTKFYNAELANEIKCLTEFEELVARVDANPAILDTLTLDELEKLNRYYEKRIRQMDAQIHALKNDQ